MLIEFQSEAGNTTGYLATPPQGSGPGLLLMHAWWGLNDFFKELADRLANEGFVVLAPDLYGGKVVDSSEEAEKQINALDYRQAIKREVAALDYLLNHPATAGNRVGAIGFSMGGGYATWLSTLRPEVAALVLFYGGSEQSSSFASETGAAFLGHFAEGDEWEPDEGVKQLESQLRSAGREVNFYFYPGVGHWFFEDNRPDAYNQAAARTAWDRTVKFLHEKLG
jgi:carboxymethylenebutenolidase